MAPGVKVNHIQSIVVHCGLLSYLLFLHGLQDAQTGSQLRSGLRSGERVLVDGRVAGHLSAADGLKTSSIHVCVCPHFGM